VHVFIEHVEISKMTVHSAMTCTVSGIVPVHVVNIKIRCHIHVCNGLFALSSDSVHNIFACALGRVWVCVFASNFADWYGKNIMLLM